MEHPVSLRPAPFVVQHELASERPAQLCSRGRYNVITVSPTLQFGSTLNFALAVRGKTRNTDLHKEAEGGN